MSHYHTKNIILNKSPLFPFYKDILDSIKGNYNLDVDTEYRLIVNCDENTGLWNIYDIKLINKITDKVISISPSYDNDGLCYGCFCYYKQIDNNYPVLQNGHGLKAVKVTRHHTNQSSGYEILSVLYSLKKEGRI